VLDGQHEKRELRTQVALFDLGCVRRLLVALVFLGPASASVIVLPNSTYASASWPIAASARPIEKCVFGLATIS
jgi:hypothetical protein